MINIDLAPFGDEKYKSFITKLAPDSTLPFLGVRMPKLKEIAKQYPLDYVAINYAEDILLQCLIIGNAKCPFKEKIAYLDYIIPQFSSWAMTDCLATNLKLKKEDENIAFEYAAKLTFSKMPYVERAGIVIMLARFLSDSFIDEVLATLLRCSKQEERYMVQMAIAWALATAVAKYKTKTIECIKCVDNPSILKLTAQKCRDSRRVDKETKAFISKIAKDIC